MMPELSIKAQSFISHTKDLDAEMLRGSSYHCAWLVTTVTAAPVSLNH